MHTSTQRTLVRTLPIVFVSLVALVALVAPSRAEPPPPAEAAVPLGPQDPPPLYGIGAPGGPSLPSSPGDPSALPPPPVYSGPVTAPPPVAIAPVAAPPSSFVDFIVPKAFSLTVGWSYTPTNSLPLSSSTTALTPQGTNLDGALMWQVRGFDGVRWPAWIGFMTSFFYYVGGEGINDFLGVSYGIYVKHALFPGPRIRLFGAYGLGAAQVWIRGVDSRGIGHLTRLSLGADVHMTRSLQMTFEFSYRFIDMPSFDLAGTGQSDFGFHTLSLVAGIWLGK